MNNIFRKQFTKLKFIIEPQKNFLSQMCPSFKFSDLHIEIAKKRHPSPDPTKLLFGHNFTDHMFEVYWDSIEGWSQPKITPMHNLSIHPAAKVLHYASELFEGMKSYRGYDNDIRLFRPDLNMERLLRTAKRAALPTFDANEMIKCIMKLIEIDIDCIPHSTKSSLYLRPTLIGTEATLGVDRSHQACLFVIAGPVGPYFQTGFKPISLLADPRFVRAWLGGCGAYKMGSNYAPTVLMQKEALEKNCQQVLWLYGPDHQITEVGTMNFFMHWFNEDGVEELITPGLESGLILPGVTRQSLLDLSRLWNEFKVTEKSFTMDILIKALKEKRVIELFGSGTACVVCPVANILYENKILEIPTNPENDSLSMRFFSTLHDIQYGKVDHPWAIKLSEEDLETELMDPNSIKSKG